MNLGQLAADDDFDRADSDDSEDDYDGVPRTEEIPLPPSVLPLDRDKMEITLERHSSSSAQEMLDVPITQTVEDSQLVRPDSRIKGKSTI